MKILFFIFFFAVLFCSISCKNEQPTTTVYLVRHAEKDTTDKGENPALTAIGIERSLRLKELLSDVSFTKIYSTKYDRNLLTILPLCEKQTISPILYGWYDWEDEVRAIQSAEGVFLICGHGDNLLPMIAFMNGVPPYDGIGHHEYDNLFKVSIYRDTTLVEVIKF